jgi:hypothetical protein
MKEKEKGNRSGTLNCVRVEFQPVGLQLLYSNCNIIPLTLPDVSKRTCAQEFLPLDILRFDPPNICSRKT